MKWPLSRKLRKLEISKLLLKLIAKTKEASDYLKVKNNVISDNYFEDKLSLYVNVTLYIITMMAKIDVVQHLGQVSHLAKAYFGFCGMTPVLVLLLLPLDAKLVHYMLPS